jgi:lysophospholipase L1-like esterase
MRLVAGTTRFGIRERWLTGALLLSSLALSVLVAEMLVRLAGAAPGIVIIQQGRFRLSPNPLIGYEPAPATDHREGTLDFYDYWGASNRLGYRDDDHEVAKPPGTDRIVVLGDSIGAGVLVERGREIFPYLLQDRLRADGIPAEVINLSVSGYNTQQEIETLKAVGLDFSPDLVLLAYCLNDRRFDGGGIMEALLDLEAAPRGIPRARVIHPLLVRSALWRFLRYVALPRGGARGVSHRDFHLDAIGEDTSEAYLHELGRLAREHGFEAVVAVFPILDRFDDYPYPYEHERMERLAGEAGLHHLDLLEPLQECAASLDGPIGRDFIHPGPEGHHCAAEAMADHIEVKVLGLLP